MRRLGIVLPTAALGLLLTAAPALACGGLIGPNGAVNLLQTTTFAGYHDGEEHYVTAFEFAGGGGAFGSITPLPGVPSSVVKGGAWTLQRLELETNQLLERADFAAAVPAASGAQELMKVQIDALDITVLKGGSADIGAWAKAHGFRLPPDAPEVLDFYARRSPIFLAAAFDADKAAERGQQIGDGTPVQITIPTDNPWVPLRILALGKTADEPVQADVFLLTDRQPALLPYPTGLNGTRLDYDAAAGDKLLDDLRSDRGMGWVPTSGWLTKVAVAGNASQLTYDLAIDATGAGAPSAVAAGLELPTLASPTPVAADAGIGVDARRLVLALAVSLVGLAGVVVLARSRPGGVAH